MVAIFFQFHYFISPTLGNCYHRIMNSLRCLFVLALLTIAPLSAQNVPALVNYQGRLLDAAGNPRSGNVSLELTVHTAATGGTQVYTETLNPVPVNNGLFSLQFGGQPGFAAALANAEAWLEVQVDGSVVGPRSRLVAVPYALKAASSTALDHAEPPASVIPVQGMVWIRPGTFLMGSRAGEVGRFSDEGPQTSVTLTRGFWMGAHEVTQAEYLAVMGTNPSAFTGDVNRPVEQVSWNNAVAYTAALTTTERAAGRIPTSWGYRLPTEAEWEYACRAGASTTRYNFGDDASAATIGNYAWYSANSGSTTQRVEQKLPNAWGLRDMHGNVREWCQDFYGAYPGGSVTDPQGPVSGSFRVIRGGGWVNTANLCRSAQRSDDIPGGTLNTIGFRVVLAPVLP